MATNRNILQCAVCGTLSCVRTLIGYLDQHPIRIYCGKCGIEIQGKVFIDQKRATYRFEFANAVDVGKGDLESADYYMEASGELLTLKLQRTPQGKVPPFVSPFFRAQAQMGVEGVEDFKKKVLPFIETARNQWPAIKRINDLWARGNNEFLRSELRKLLPEKIYPLTNRLELLKGVRHTTIAVLYPLLDWRRFAPRVEYIHKHVKRSASIQPQKAIELAKEFSRKGLLERYRSMLLARIDAFMEVFPYLIPVFSQPFFRRGFTREVYAEYGLSTCSLEDIKNFYSDTYEDVLLMSRLAVAFNNLSTRGDHRVMAPRRKDVSTLDDFDNLSKGSRLVFLSGHEQFDLLLNGALNVGVRNAIAHNSITYDGRTQEVVYYPDGNKTGVKQERMYLLQFGELCRESLYALVNLSELALWTERLNFMAEGESPDYSAFLAMSGGAST
ncbi:MAG: hypothetical protein WC969_04780 [Elusimicrobiota bacterium]|jgi:hypothetical protein